MLIGMSPEGHSNRSRALERAAGGVRRSRREGSMPHATVLAVDPDRVNLCAIRHCFHHAGVEAVLARSAGGAARRVVERAPGGALVRLGLGAEEAPGLVRSSRPEYGPSPLPIPPLPAERH